MKPTLKGKEIKFHLVKGRVTKNSWTCFKTATSGYLYCLYFPDEETSESGEVKCLVQGA